MKETVNIVQVKGEIIPCCQPHGNFHVHGTI